MWGGNTFWISIVPARLLCGTEGNPDANCVTHGSTSLLTFPLILDCCQLRKTARCYIPRDTRLHIFLSALAKFSIFGDKFLWFCSPSNWKVMGSKNICSVFMYTQFSFFFPDDEIQKVSFHLWWWWYTILKPSFQCLLRSRTLEFHSTQKEAKMKIYTFTNSISFEISSTPRISRRNLRCCLSPSCTILSKDDEAGG